MEIIEKCLRSLKTHKSDSEKLAVLMVLSKVSEDLTIDKNTIARLYEGIHPEFLLRLLKSTPTDESGNTFNVVGINAVSFFAHRDPEIFFKNRYGEQLIDQIFILFDPLKKSKKKDLYIDAINILLGISELDEGVHYFLRKKLFTKLSHLFIDSEKSLIDKVETLFTSLLQYDGRLNPDFLEHLESISNSYMIEQEITKFNHLKIISWLFKLMVNCSIQLEESDKERFSVILKNISIGSQHIMQSHVKGDLKRSVIILISHSMSIYDKYWIFDSNLVESVKHFNFLLLTVISVELKMNVLYPEKITVEDQNDNFFIESSLFIAQNVLYYICSDHFELDTLVADNDFISKIFNSLKNIMSTVFELLATYKDKIDDYFKNPASVAVISMFSSWVTEETENLRDELEKSLPMIVEIMQKDLSNIEKTNGKALYIDILTPAILQVIPEKKMRQILINNNCHDVFIRYFSHLLNTLDESDESNGSRFEPIFHMIHQLTIFNRKLCGDDIILKACVQHLITKRSYLISNLGLLGDFLKLEIIVVTLQLFQLTKTKCDNTLAEAINFYVKILYEVSMKKDSMITEVWLIAFDNVFACLVLFDQLKSSLADSPYVKKWLVQLGNADKEIKESIKALTNLIKT